MDFILTITFAVLQGYLTLTNQLAHNIEALFPPPTTAIETTAAQPTLTTLGSVYSHLSTLSDILLQNRAYQEATVVNGISPVNTTTDPVEALVNVFCTLRSKDAIQTTTGTGVFVHPSGIILTNAHVAQFLLLQNTSYFETASCSIRTGNPATATYEAKLLYIPPTWIQKNAALISKSSPSGTGERDYALLYITNSLTEEELPETFPALTSNTELLSQDVQGQEITVAGYPAGNLLTNGSQSDLLPRSATTTISELYTFASNHVDVFGIRSTIVGESGSSGGPVISEDGRLIGLITTRGDIERDGPSSLRAITLSHIHRTILQETGFTFAQNLHGDTAYRATVFNNTLAPFLTQTLEWQLRN